MIVPQELLIHRPVLHYCSLLAQFVYIQLSGFSLQNLQYRTAIHTIKGQSKMWRCLLRRVLLVFA